MLPIYCSNTLFEAHTAANPGIDSNLLVDVSTFCQVFSWSVLDKIHQYLMVIEIFCRRGFVNLLQNGMDCRVMGAPVLIWIDRPRLAIAIAREEYTGQP